MAFDGVRYFSAVLVTSENAKGLYEFYKDKLKFPLEPEQHGDTDPHYGCEMGDLHFAIHPTSNFEGEACGVGAVKMAFEVFDIEDFVKHLESVGVKTIYPIKEMGPMKITALKDPDGNHVEFTQLNERWIGHLEERRKNGFDMISEFKKRNAAEAQR